MSVAKGRCGVNYSEQPPSTQWSALKYRGEIIAEVWFKPEAEPLALTFRIRRASFQVAGIGQRLTPENLLKAVGLEAVAVESCRREGASLPESDGSASDLGRPLPTPPQDVSQLTLHVRLKPPPQAVAPDKGEAPEVPEAVWQDLEARWNAILGLEASIETLRISMESLRSELEASRGRQLKSEEKFYALNADVAQWTKAKNRLHHALPKMREFIHRAVWVLGAPERKKLDELFKTYVQPRVPFSEMGAVAEQLENLRKARQVLSAHGVAVYQESKNISAEVKGALRTLQANAARRAIQKRGGAKARGKFI
jgi:hypothetical protein